MKIEPIVARCLALLVALTLAFAGTGFAARAQTPPPLVGVLYQGPESLLPGNLAALRAGMTALGHVEGRTYRLEIRYGGSAVERLPGLAAELLHADPAVILAAPGVAAQEAWRASKTVPIVLAYGTGLLEAGMITSLAKPGGNVTGILNRIEELTEKLFEILHELAPDARKVLLLGSGVGIVETEVRQAGRRAGDQLGMTVTDVIAGSPERIAALPELCLQHGCQAVVIVPDPVLLPHTSDVARAIEAMRVPSVSSSFALTSAGVLASYAAPTAPAWRGSANYVDRILKGAPPGELPIERMAVFELAVNLRAAKALGLAVPHSLLLRADEVIE